MAVVLRLFSKVNDPESVIAEQEFSTMPSARRYLEGFLIKRAVVLGGEDGVVVVPWEAITLIDILQLAKEGDDD